MAYHVTNQYGKTFIFETEEDAFNMIGNDFRENYCIRKVFKSGFWFEI